MGEIYTQEELNNILELHKLWLNSIGTKGQCADLSYADLRNANLRSANLSYADLRNANLRSANLSYVNLSGANLRSANLRSADLRNADLSYANLRSADLSYVNLSGADLRNADLSYVNLSGADLRNADLRNANLSYADLRNANLRSANLSGVEYNEFTAFFALQCPEEGSFIGYKQIATYDNDGHNAIFTIAKLEICADAKRSSATSRKCRCSKAKVLSIESFDGKEKFESGCSFNNSSFIYKVGEIVEVKDFDENRWNECSTGIHFFITRDEAVQYC